MVYKAGGLAPPSRGAETPLCPPGSSDPAYQPLITSEEGVSESVLEQSTNGFNAGVSLGVQLCTSLGDKVHVREEDVGTKHQIRHAGTSGRLTFLATLFSLVFCFY